MAFHKNLHRVAYVFAETAGRPSADVVVDVLADRSRETAAPAGMQAAGNGWLGAVPIIIDPIFSGLAWSLIFGLFASTLFTLFVIPVAYWLIYADRPGHGLPVSTMDKEERVHEPAIPDP